MPLIRQRPPGSITSSESEFGVYTDPALASTVRVYGDPVRVVSDSEGGVIRLGAAGDGFEAKFRRLAREWKEATAYTSSVTRIAKHPAGRQLVELGNRAVPLVLKELAHPSIHWFIALSDISGEDPVPPEHKGRLEEMAKDWLRWGREHGYR